MSSTSTWTVTGISARGDTASARELQEDMRLDARIMEEAGPVVTRPIVERILPRGSGNGDGLSRDVYLTRGGLAIGGGLLADLPRDTRNAHVEVHHADKVLRIVLADDGAWKVPKRSGIRMGGNYLVQRLVDCGMKVGTRYRGRVEGNAIVVHFGRRGR